MKLYSAPHSPYAARVRIQVLAKNLPVEFVDPPGFRTPEYKKINLTGKIPALDIDGFILPESLVIMDYLEDVYTDKPLRPADPKERALVNLFARFPDAYLHPSLFPMFSQLFAPAIDESAVRGYMDTLQTQLKILEQLMEMYGRDVGGDIDYADCTFAPTMLFLRDVPAWFGYDQLVFGDLPRVRAWWDWCVENPHSGAVIEEMHVALAQFWDRMQSQRKK